MQGLVIALFCSILAVEYLVEQRGLLHPYVVLIPEVLRPYMGTDRLVPRRA